MAGESSALSFSSFSRSSFSHFSSADSSSSSTPSSPSVVPDVLSGVPFLWEEKPGVSKYESPKIRDLNPVPFLSTLTRKADSFDSTFVPSDDFLDLPPLRLPPRLQKTSLVDSSPLKGCRTPCSSSTPSSPSVASDVLCVVPFLWEEKPGVSKHESPKIRGLKPEPFPSTYTRKEASFNSTFVPSDDFMELPPLRLPPRLQKTSLSDSSASLKGCKTPCRDGVGSQTFPQTKQQLRSKPEEDPFWLAMNVCTKVQCSSVYGAYTGMRGFGRLMKKRDQWSSASEYTTRDSCAPKNRYTGKNLDNSSLQASTFASEKALRSAARSSAGLAAKKEQAGMEARARAMQASGNRSYFRTFDEELVQSSNANRETFDGGKVTIVGKRPSSSPRTQHRSQRIDLYRVRIAQTNELTGKSLLSDLFGCKSIHRDSVIDPSLYPLTRGSFQRPSVS